METVLTLLAGGAIGSAITYALHYRKMKDVTEQFIDKSVVTKMLREELRKATPHKPKRRYYKNTNGKKKTSKQSNRQTS